MPCFLVQINPSIAVTVTALTRIRWLDHSVHQAPMLIFILGLTQFSGVSDSVSHFREALE